MTRLDFVLVLTLISTCVVPCSMASTIHVPADQPTIQAGINAAKNRDRVVVAPGTYVENINFLGKAITVTSSGGPKVTIIDGSAAAPVAVFVTGEGPKSVLSRFTLQNGYGTFAYQYQGGGVSISNASPTIKGNIIINNNGNGDGGGIGVYFGSPIITSNTIAQNYAQFGGGMSFVGASSAQVLHNTISGNTAGIAGGVELFAAATVFMEDNKILGNSAYSQGGGIWIVNEADEVIVQNVFANNLSSSGSQIYGSIPQSQIGYALINNTIISAPNGNADAAVIADGFNQNVLIENNVIYGVGDNAALLCNPNYQGGPPIVEYNDAYNATLAYGDSCSGFGGTNGNISGDPQLKNVAKSNYQLKSTSPAINAGSNSAPDLPSKDLAGHPRIVGGIIDMGAYEYQGK